MKAAGIFISSLIIIDTFFVSYAVGLNSRHVLVVDPRLPPVKAGEVKKPAATTAQATMPGKEGTPTGQTMDKSQSKDPSKSQSKDHGTGDAGSAKASKPHKKTKKSHE